MADRYQDRPFPDDGDYDRAGDQSAAGRGESDPLAELARLIGQTDPFGTMGRANAKILPRATPRDQYQSPVELDEAPPAGPPAWMQRASRQEIPEQDGPPEYPSAVHPLQRYARAAPEPHYPEEQQYADEPDPARYDDALYGQIDGAQPSHDPAYAEDEAYAYQGEYDEGAEEQTPRRRGGMTTVIVVLALAVLGTGAAFAYRTYVGSPRSGEPPVIKADTTPIKIVPAPSRRVRQGAGPNERGRRHREDRSAGRGSGRRQRQGQPPRGAGADEPEWQSAAAGQCCPCRPATRGRQQRYLAQQRAPKDQDPDRTWRPGRRRRCAGRVRVAGAGPARETGVSRANNRPRHAKPACGCQRQFQCAAFAGAAGEPAAGRTAELGSLPPIRRAPPSPAPRYPAVDTWFPFLHS